MIADYETAKYISDVLLDVNERLSESLKTVETRAPNHEYRIYSLAIGRIINWVFEAILEPIYMRHPSLKPPDLEL
jgi:hypothetical protein